MGKTKRLLRTTLTLCLLFLLLLGFSYPHIEPGSGPYIATVLSLIPIALTLIGVVVVTVAGWEPLD